MLQSSDILRLQFKILGPGKYFYSFTILRFCHPKSKDIAASLPSSSRMLFPLLSPRPRATCLAGLEIRISCCEKATLIFRSDLTLINLKSCNHFSSPWMCLRLTTESRRSCFGNAILLPSHGFRKAVHIWPQAKSARATSAV